MSPRGDLGRAQARRGTGAIMSHYQRASDRIGLHIRLRPRWKGNLCLLGLTAVVVFASVLLLWLR
jgi:hypothetical protein